MQSQLTEVIIYDTVQLVIKVVFLKISSDIVKHVEIVINAFILMFTIFYFLNY